MAFAENRVEVKVTSEPIQYEYGYCQKAGGFTLEFDPESTLIEGDIITIDLDYGALVCKEIDLEISDGGSTTPWINANIPLAGSVVIDPTNTVLDINQGVYFRLFAADGSQRITLSVRDNEADYVNGVDPDVDGLQVGSSPDDTLILYFLDQQTNANFANPGIWIDGADNDNDYETAATAADNTLCIELVQGKFPAGQTTVDANLDSTADKFTFIPSNPQIAHVVDVIGFEVIDCKGVKPERIDTADVTQGPGCPAFDWDAHYPGNGYCTIAAPQVTDNLFIIATTEPDVYFQDLEYQISMEIRTDGIYWTDQAVNVTGYSSEQVACGSAASAQPFGAQAQYVYTKPIGSPIDAANTDCDETGPQMLLTNCDTINTADASHIKAININIPALKYNLEEITPGDEVLVEITLLNCPCGVVFSTTVSLGYLGCDTGIGGSGQSLLFPYYTSCEDANGDGFWDGFAVVNTSGSAGEAVIYCYENDGDAAQMTVAVPAHGMYVATTNGMMNAPVGGQVLAAMTQTGGTGTWGDDRCYMVVCADFHCDGFAFMGQSNGSTAKGESMGYLPRNTSNYCPE